MYIIDKLYTVIWKNWKWNLAYLISKIISILILKLQQVNDFGTDHLFF